MKRTINTLTILMLFALALACTDDSKDPFRFKQLEKGSLLALRGADGSQAGLNPDANFFFKDAITGSETFSYIADFISEDQTLLESVQVFARIGTGPRTSAPVATIPGSAFTIPSGGLSRQGTVSVTLSAILAGLGLTPADAANLDRTDIIIESDIILTNGTTVPSAAIINTGLFAAAAFFPAHTMNYYAEETADFVPVATTSMAGEFVKVGTTVTRPVVPLRSGVKDTLYIVYDQDIIDPPVVNFANATQTELPLGVSAGPLVKVGDDTFYTIVTANAGFTGTVTATITGATSDDFGPELMQNSKTQTINVDNTGPIITSSSTGTRIGAGQFVTITINFNEAMSAKSANAIKATITDPNNKLKPVTDATMALSANGLTATLVYLFELINPNDPAVHGPLTLSYSGGADLAGNAVQGGVATGGLTIDVGAPPAPAVATVDPYDLGTQIRWRWTQGGFSGGSTTGTIYFVAVNEATSAQTTIPGPTSVSFDADLNAIWVMPDDPNSTTTPKAKVAIRQTGSITVTSGNSGTSGSLTTIFTPFTANRSITDDMGTPLVPGDDVVRGMNIYAVFRSTSGTVSAITAAPQLKVIME